MKTASNIIDNILMEMQPHLSAEQLGILKNVLVKEMQGVEVIEEKNEVATIDDSNEHILNLYRMKKGTRLSEKTMEFYFYTIKRLLAAIPKKLTDITTNDIEAYLYMIRRDNSEISCNNQLRNLSAVFSWMRKQHIITENPCEAVEKFKQVQKPIDHMESDDWETLKEGCTTKRDRALLEFMRCTGLRREEVTSINVKDIGQNGEVFVYGEKTKTYRYAYLDKVAIKFVGDYLKERDAKANEPLFKTQRGNTRLTGDGIYTALKTIAKRSGIDRNIYPHLIRKTAATNIIRRGGSVGDAGLYLGHKDNTVTGKHYAYQGEEMSKRVFEKYVAV